MEKKIKTATVTWHYYNNYGTQLQEYALQRYILSLQYKNFIFDDTDILKTIRSKHIKVSCYVVIKRFAKNILLKIKRFFVKNTLDYYYNSIRSLESFKKHYLFTKKVNFKNLPKYHKEFSAFICGSDQIWSPLDYNFFGYYWLDFVTKNKISYATSLGTTKIDLKIEDIRKYLKSFSSISVREKQSSIQLNKLLNTTDVKFVCDPTLLFDKTFWGDFSKKIKTKETNYLLCYYLENKEWYFKYARGIAKKLGLRVLLIPNKKEFNRNSWVIKQAVGPKEFVSYFKNASYVITDSYHGSIFSLLFEKQFTHLLRFEEDNAINQNIRIESLFSYLSLDNIVCKRTNTIAIPTTINYSVINGKLESFRIESRNYLKDALQKVKRF